MSHVYKGIFAYRWLQAVAGSFGPSLIFFYLNLWVVQSRVKPILLICNIYLPCFEDKGN